MSGSRLRPGVPATWSLRTRLSWSATLVVAGWSLALGVGADLLVGASLARQADAVLGARAEAAAATVRVGPTGAVSVLDVREDRALDAGTWILSTGGRVVEGPASASGAVVRQVLGLAGRGQRSLDVGLAEPVRLLALPVQQGGEQVATVVTSTSLAPYTRLEHVAVVASAVAAAALLVVVHLVLRANVRRALRPVQEMTAQAGRWSTDDVDRRFGPEPRPAELADLARTLDGVLGRLSAVLRHEQRFTAELSHELRTPLARVQAEVDWLRDRPRGQQEAAASLACADEALGGVRDILESLLGAARAGLGAAPGCAALAPALAPLVHRLRERRPRVHVALRLPPGLDVGVDEGLLQRLLSPVLDNAVRYAAREVAVLAGPVDGVVEVTVCDDGPGVAPGVAEHVFEPGFRGDPDDGHDGAGLGLALAQRLARSAGGSIAVAPGAGGGRLTVRLPPG